MDNVLSTNRLRFLLGLICYFVWISPVLPCNVPVFRFALERWKPDDYQVLLLHDGELNKMQNDLLAAWEAKDKGKPSNTQRRVIDLRNTEQPETQKYATLLSQKDQPILALFYPQALKIDDTLWTAPLNEKTLEELYDSALRRDLVSRLVQGQSAVWLFVESGNSEKDNAAETLLTAELKKLEGVLRLPVLTDAPEDQLLGGPPLAVKFSVLRIPRTNNEDVLRQLLFHCEPDIPARHDPLVYPVFGRGRSLLPMIGAGITADNIQEYAEFLVGACSCEIKEQNPGFDLLLAADWDALLKEQGYKPVAISSKDPVRTEPETVMIPAGSRVVSNGGVKSEVGKTNSEIVSARPIDSVSSGKSANNFKWYAGLGLAAILGLGIALRMMIRRT